MMTAQAAAAPSQSSTPGKPLAGPNLTEDQLVRHQNDTSPLPNHSLVICKRVESGYVIRRVIPPNKLFTPLFRGRRNQYFTYAVPHGAKWLSFTRTYPTPEPVPNIQLSFTLTFQVHHQARLIETLRDDPLRILQNAVEAEFGRVIQRLSWTSPLAGGMKLERYSLPQEPSQGLTNNDAIAASIFAVLQAVGLEYGLLVTRLAVSRNLSPQEREFLEKREVLRHEDELQHHRHLITLKQSTFDELLAKLRLLIGRLAGPGADGWGETIDELRQFVKIFQEFVALPAPALAPGPARSLSSGEVLQAQPLGREN